MTVATIAWPAHAMDVKLTFFLPKGVGQLEAAFAGFDLNSDGWISSADHEVISAWSSTTGAWEKTSGNLSSKAATGTVDIRYAYDVAGSGAGVGYPGNEFLGLSRFVIETKSQNNNHVNSNGMTFRGDVRFGYLSAYGLSWSDTYNAPSSFSYTFEGPDNQVRLALTASGSPVPPPVPEPGTAVLFAAGSVLMLILTRRWRQVDRSVIGDR
ncbi:MAG: PEP-CTERM sorting domain-containing protein [Burkholderiales bacterium]|nr:PEP-CTERM sorting domain-containing protein [Burkholderiales bacterium]